MDQLVALRAALARATLRVKNNPGDPGAAADLTRAREAYAVAKVLEQLAPGSTASS